MRDLEELAGIAVNCGLQVHRGLGPGLLESVYEAVLARMLEREGLGVQRQVPVSFAFDGLEFRDAFRTDILVEGRLVIEVKSVESLHGVHAKQLLTYLRLMEQPLGLIMNFGAGTFREGVRRVVNGHVDFASSRLRVHNPPDRGS